MDFEYMRNMFTKYRIAIAIAVLKSKPEEMTTDAYILHLQEMLKNGKSSEDLALTVCSDDFEFDEENTQINSTNFHLNANNGEDNVMNVDNDSNDSMTILQSLDVRNFEGNSTAMAVDKTKKIIGDSNVFDMLREIDRDSQDVSQHTITIPRNFSKTFCESLTQSYNDNDIPNSKLQALENINKTQNKETTETISYTDNNINIDSQTTQLYTIPDYTQNYTHISQSQDNLIISEKFIKRKTINVEKDVMNNNFSNIDPMDEVLNTEFNQNAQVYEFYTQENITTLDCESTRKDNNIGLNQYSIEGTDNTGEDSNLDISQNNTMIYVIEHAIEKNKSINKTACDSNENNLQDIDSDTRSTDTYQHAYNFVLKDKNAQDKTTDYKNFEINNKLTHNVFKDCTKDDKTFERNNNPTQNYKDVNVNTISNDIEDSIQTEAVPFKVIEELSKMKTFLYKNARTNDGYSTDSGYKSESQTRCYKSGGLSGSSTINWVDQSAHSLFDYVTRCPLVANTQEITGEISQILGEVIDKLNEEENYPSFLEELLETANLLVEELFEGSNDESSLQKKDEIIQRLCLLNKSCHILKFTIEKTTNILEKLHKNLTNKESLLETDNINQIENSSYIIHLLQILLQRYLKVKDNLSQSSQLSQEDKLKKSSITEIWRRKWNPKYEVTNEGSFVKECVLTKCCIVLNKIIVDCINGYSLIAYAALQCFNLIQS